MWLPNSIILDFCYIDLKSYPNNYFTFRCQMSSGPHGPIVFRFNRKKKPAVLRVRSSSMGSSESSQWLQSLFLLTSTTFSLFEYFRFKQKYSLKSHILTHSEKRHKCNKCGRSFTLYGQLKSHIRTNHQGIVGFLSNTQATLFFYLLDCLTRRSEQLWFVKKKKKKKWFRDTLVLISEILIRAHSYTSAIYSFFF